MLLSSMKHFSALKWEWDFVINLSESDFPIKSLESLEAFLTLNKGLNFVKSHGREVQRFIKKQGLDKTFIECESHMWRIGDRKLPTGIVIDGGSDWIALSPEFVSYIVKEKKDQLLQGLDPIFQHTLLPAESYFHTVLRNSRFCNTYVDNNLHVTNWKRKLGCKCQYKHVVDWCGCSPNDFRVEDWPRIQNTLERQLFFARKFEPIINQEIITRVEQSIGIDDHNSIHNLEAYWQTIYNRDDLTANTDDLLLTHSGSIIRHNARILMEEKCVVNPGEIIEINSFNYADIYKGNLILYKVVIDSVNLEIETWYKPQNHLEFNKLSPFIDNVKTFKVSSDYDQKEQTFRNLANVLGPLSDPVLLYHFTAPFDKGFENLTLVWLDSAGVVADVTELQVQENNLTNFIKPNLKHPLLPGVWKVALVQSSEAIVVHTKFLVTPLELFSGRNVTEQESTIIHSGSQSSYKNYSYVKVQDFLPTRNESISLQRVAHANIKRTGLDLLEWVDSLSNKFYNVLGSCFRVSNSKLDRISSCASATIGQCASTKWSSLSPDPKGHIGTLNEKTGKLERFKT